MPGERISIMEAAARLGISRQTVWRWAHSGRVRAYRIGDAPDHARIMVNADDVDALVQPLVTSKSA